MHEGLVLETREALAWTPLGYINITKVKLSSEQGILLNLKIMHYFVDSYNNILANAVLQIIRTFADDDEEVEA